MFRSNWRAGGPAGGRPTEVGRARDAYERDGGLQQRTGQVYAGLAAADWGGPWLTLGPETQAADVAATLYR